MREPRRAETDRPQQAAPQLADLPFDDIAAATIAIVRTLKQRGQTAETAGGDPGGEPGAGFTTPAARVP